VLTAVVLALVVAAPPHPELAARAQVLRLEARLRQASAHLVDHTALFYKREWIDGALQPAEHIALKWRRETPARGANLYMKWIAGYHKGRELLWRGERTMRVKAGILALDVDTDGVLVRGQSRHDVKEAGLARVSEKILADIARAKARKHARSRTAGPRRCRRTRTPRSSRSRPRSASTRARRCPRT
jgi:hypothetical protein